MARFEEKQGFAITYSPTREERRHEGNHAIDMEEVVASPCWFCCLRFGGGKKSNQESNHLLQRNVDNNGEYSPKGSWFVSKLKKLKEFSELVAGPKWKNFIRKIGRHFKPRKLSKTQCVYSPNSYALNFDDGRHLEEEEDDFLVSFSSRFSAAALSSIDKQRPATTSSLL